MKKIYKCDWCKKEFERLECYMKGKKHVFCSRQCFADYSNKIKNPDGYAELKNFNNISNHMTKLNVVMNPSRMTPGTKRKPGNEYSVELVSPILTYREDIETLQELVRLLRKAGGFTNASCGIHTHLDGRDHTPRSIRNFVNIIASKNDLFYKALQIEPNRMRFCKKMDNALVEKMNRKKPKTFREIESLWYEGYGESTDRHYHSSRYHFLNLHSFFQGTHTVELRGFNSELHAGKVRSYIVLALALNHQALTQKCASTKKNQTENEKFAMRTYLNRIGLIGEEFKNCREHLCSNLSGSAAWRYRSAA